MTDEAEHHNPSDDEDQEPEEDTSSPETTTRVVEVDEDSNVVRETSPASLVRNAIHSFGFGDKSPVEKDKNLDQTFVLSESKISDIEDIVSDRLSMLGSVDEDNINFSGVVRYDDKARESLINWTSY